MSPLLCIRNSQGFTRGWKCSLAMVFLLITGLTFAFWLSRPAVGAKKPKTFNGQQVFRFDTFGDEQLWTDTLRMHEVIETSIDRVTALGLGLKVDADALPDEVRQGIADGTIDLTSPATTVALLKLNAVVGVVGKVEEIRGRDLLTEVGITCALCHSTVDNSFAPGIGSRLDGWANTDLDPGKIIAASPAVSAEAKAVYNSWGPGFYDPRFNIDGLSTPLVIPPAYGLAGVDFETYTGEGPISYWNAYVAVTQMGGRGNFRDDAARHQHRP